MGNNEERKQLFEILGEADLPGMIDDMLELSAKTWDADEKARKSIDMRDNAKKGERNLENLIERFEDWSENAEELKDAAEQIAERADTAIQSRGSDPRPERDVGTYEDDEESIGETGESREEREEVERTER